MTTNLIRPQFMKVDSSCSRRIRIRINHQSPIFFDWQNSHRRTSSSEPTDSQRLFCFKTIWNDVFFCWIAGKNHLESQMSRVFFCCSRVIYFRPAYALPTPCLRAQAKCLQKAYARKRNAYASTSQDILCINWIFLLKNAAQIAINYLLILSQPTLAPGSKEWILPPGNFPGFPGQSNSWQK